MGIPLTPPPTSTVVTGDQANFIVQGTFTAIGPSNPAPMYGEFNVAIWGSVSPTLTTTAGSAAATVSSATGLAVGQTINSAGVPPGTTIGALSGTDVTLAFPPAYSAASVTAGTAAAATIGPVAVVATVQLERTFNGGATWLLCGVGGSGATAVYANPTSLSITVGECEKSVGYRMNCTAYTSGTVNYRISATGLMAVSAGVPA